MATLNISPEALDDLQDIKQYISAELQNPIAAARIVAKITKVMRRLIRFPSSGSPLTARIALQTDYRYLVSGNYLVFYRYNGNVVTISRVLYGRRDYLSILFPDVPRDDLR
jgi:addiction module RelE/StbE family toxin